MKNTNEEYTNGARPVVADIPLSDGNGKLMGKTTVTTLNTAGDLVYSAVQVIGGLILRDPNGGARNDTLPSAALLLAEIQNSGRFNAGTSFEFTVRNTADAAETITVGAGTGGTTSGTMTIAQNNSKRFLVVFTSTSGDSPAYTVYSLGTATF